MVASNKQMTSFQIGLVEESVLQSVRSAYGIRREWLLDNLGKILQFQSDTDNVDSTSPSSQDQLKIVSKFSRSLEGLVDDLLSMLSQTNLIPKVLKIFHFLHFPSNDISVALTHRTVQAITFTLFKVLKEKLGGDEKKTEAAIMQVLEIGSFSSFYSSGGQTFWITAQILRKNIVAGRKKIIKQNLGLIFSF